MVVSIRQLFRGRYKYCECGCGELISVINTQRGFSRFKHGHNQRFNWMYKRFFDNTTKYWYLWIKDHPNSRSNNWIGEHTFFYTEYHQCCILPWGVVHHKDGNKENNMIWNLEGMTRSQHMALHNPKTDHSNTICSDCGSGETYIDKRGYERWYDNKNNGFRCYNCFNKSKRKPKKPKIEKICSNCGSNTTYIDKDGHEHWNHIDGKIYCSKCRDKIRHNKRKSKYKLMST